jgi:hypothetical protein
VSLYCSLIFKIEKWHVLLTDLWDDKKTQFGTVGGNKYGMTEIELDRSLCVRVCVGGCVVRVDASFCFILSF